MTTKKEQLQLALTQQREAHEALIEVEGTSPFDEIEAGYAAEVLFAADKAVERLQVVARG